MICNPQSPSITGTSPSDCLVSYPGHSLGGGVLLLCRGAVSVFYNPSRLGKKTLDLQYIYNTKAQIDYILMNKKWVNSALNCEANSSFKGVSSDHRIVTAKIRLKLRGNTALTTTAHYDWNMLDNRDIRDKYTLRSSMHYRRYQKHLPRMTNRRTSSMPT